MPLSSDSDRDGPGAAVGELESGLGLGGRFKFLVQVPTGSALKRRLPSPPPGPLFTRRCLSHGHGLFKASERVTLNLCHRDSVIQWTRIRLGCQKWISDRVKRNLPTHPTIKLARRCNSEGQSRFFKLPLRMHCQAPSQLEHFPSGPRPRRRPAGPHPRTPSRMRSIQSPSGVTKRLLPSGPSESRDTSHGLRPEGKSLLVTPGTGTAVTEADRQWIRVASHFSESW
jgi:hypothetical protein